MGRQTILTPPTFEKETLLKLMKHTNIIFNVQDEDTALLLIFAAKILTNNPLNLPHFFKENQYQKDLLAWATKGGQQSFRDFLGKDFDDVKYLKTKNRLLLKQSPQKITYENFKSEYLTF